MAGLGEGHRIGVAVSLAVRLFDLEFERDGKYRPTVGPALVKPGKPTLTEVGTKGDPSYRRIWRVPAPASGGSPAASGVVSVGPTGTILKTGKSGTSGFEDDRPGEAPVGASTGTDLEPSTSPQLVGAGSGDEQVIFAQVAVRKARFRFNSHRAADELELELPLAALPLPADGSLVRSVLVEARLGFVDPDDWADVMTGRTNRVLADLVASDSLEPDFAGFADVHKLHMASGSSSVVSLTCRDFSGILADEPVHGRSVETSIPLDEALARFLSTFPSMVGMSVHWVGSTTPPVLGNDGPKAKGKGKKAPPVQIKADGKALDLITDVCVLAGVIPRWVGYRLELISPRTLNQITTASVPRVVLGHNVDDLELVHKMTNSHARPVEVRSFDPDRGSIVAARWPHDPKRHGALAPGEIHEHPTQGPVNVPVGSMSIDEKAVDVHTVDNIVDPERLQDIAQCIFEERARQEVQGTLKTKDVATIEGRDQGVADLLALRPGDPMAITIAPSVEESQGSYLQRLASLSAGEAQQELLKMGYSEAVAARLADGIVSTKRPLVYYTREVDIGYQCDGAIDVDVRFANYIETIDREYKGKSLTNKGGSRAKLAKAGGGNFMEQWMAIDADMLAGEITPAKALELQKDAGERERRKRGVEVGKPAPPPKATPLPTTSKAFSPKASPAAAAKPSFALKF